MIKYVRHSDIDKQLWDKRIAGSPQGMVYAYSWFLDIVSPGWDALVTANYETVFPLTWRRKAGIHYLFQPYFTQQLGMFSAYEMIAHETQESFLRSVPRKFRLIEIQLNIHNTLPAGKDFEIHPRKTHLLELSGDHSSISKQYSENLRRNLKKPAEAMDIGSCTVPEIVELFRSNRGSTVENLKQHDYAVFESLMNAATSRGLVETLSCRNDKKELTAGAVFLRSVHSWIFIFSATSREGKETGAMSRIIDTFIARHAGEHTVLDFEGSMDENLARFYKGFGSKEVVYLQIRKNNLPLLIRWLKK